MTRVLGPDATAAEVTETLDRLQQQGFAVRVVPAAPTMQGTLDSFARVLDFPDYFGHNLNALLDCLRDIGYAAQDAVEDGEDPALVAVVLADAATLRAADPELLDAFVKVLRIADSEIGELRTVVVDGPVGRGRVAP